MINDSAIKVGGIDFKWNLEKGLFLFEEQDAVLFWISSAMKEFFDTIEEISGEDASNLVFETTGFRQGLVVGKYFEDIKDVTSEEAAKLITNTYASAGWGRAVIRNLDIEAKKLTVHLQDSWEYKINVAQGKKQGSNFLSAHYAGIFTGLLGTNLWYKIIQSQIEGHEETIIELFPSEITISDNIHELSRKKENEQIEQLEALVEDKTRDLKLLVKELSSPLIPVHDGIVVVPLIGKYDEDRSEELLEKTLKKLPDYKANFLVLDLTGLGKDISVHTSSLIHKIGSVASLIGTQTILVGISPELSLVISQSDISFKGYECFQTLQHGIHYALGQQGRTIV